MRYMLLIGLTKRYNDLLVSVTTKNAALRVEHNKDTTKSSLA